MGLSSQIPEYIYLLLALPAAFVACSAILFVKYKGWESFNLNSADNGGFSVSPWAEREFILEQYRKFQKHTDKINQIIRLRGQIDAKERRHDTVLRDLIQTRQFGHAEAYLNAMISMCKESGDLDGEITYITYLDTLDEMKSEEPAVNAGGSDGLN